MVWFQVFRVQPGASGLMESSFYPMPGVVYTPQVHKMATELAQELANPTLQQGSQDLAIGEMHSYTNHLAFQHQVEASLSARNVCPGCQEHVEDNFVPAKGAQKVHLFKGRLYHDAVLTMCL